MKMAKLLLGLIASSLAAATEGEVETPPPDTHKDGWRPRTVREVYEQYDEKPYLDHWMEYAEHYDDHLPKPDGVTPLKMMEIGVQSGGSARMWKQYYGKPLKYVGLDINPKCKRTESPEENIFVEIGSQLDRNFLSRVCAKHGPFDVVIDDGGHTALMMQTTLAHMWNHSTACLSEKATYVIEDMHTMAMCKAGFCDKPSDVTDVIGNAFYGMHAHWFANNFHGRGDTHPKPAPEAWASQIRSISLYDSMAFFKRGRPLQRLQVLQKGSDKIPYRDTGHTHGAAIHASHKQRVIAPESQ